MSFITEYGISDVIVMGNLNIIKKNYILKFCRVTDNAFLSDKSISSDKCAGTNFGFGIDDAGSVYICIRIDLCRFMDPDILALFLELIGT